VYNIISELDTTELPLTKLFTTEFDAARILLLVLLKLLCFVSHMKLWATGSSSVTDEVFYIVQCTSTDAVIDPFVYASTFIVLLQTSMVFAHKLLKSALKALHSTDNMKFGERSINEL
jgi:hypothetical protein